MIIRIPEALSKKLYLQNVDKYGIVKVYPGHYFNLIVYRKIPPLSEITATMIAIDKYTIVELTYDGKHYQGLAAKANCDKNCGITGIAVAYNRAFKMLCGVKL